MHDLLIVGARLSRPLLEKNAHFFCKKSVHLFIFFIEVNLSFNPGGSERSLEDHSAGTSVPGDVAAVLEGGDEGEVCIGS